MVKKKQPCTHFYCFIVSIIAALFKFYTKSVKIIDKIFFSYYLSRIIRGLPKNLSAGATYKNSCCCSQGGFNDPFVELYLRLLLPPFPCRYINSFFVFRSLSFFYTLLRLFFFSNNGPSPFELFAGPHSLLWHLRCDGEQLFPVINCYERGHLSQLTELNQGKKYYWCWRCCWLEYEWAILLWTADEQIGGFAISLLPGFDEITFNIDRQIWKMKNVYRDETLKKYLFNSKKHENKSHCHQSQSRE